MRRTRFLLILKTFSGSFIFYLLVLSHKGDLTSYDRVPKIRGTIYFNYISSLKFDCNIFIIQQAVDECLAKPLKSSKTKILDFARAYQLERVFLFRKSMTCNLPYKKLKELVKQSSKFLLAK